MKKLLLLSILLLLGLQIHSQPCDPPCAEGEVCSWAYKPVSGGLTEEVAGWQCIPEWAQ